MMLFLIYFFSFLFLLSQSFLKQSSSSKNGTRMWAFPSFLSSTFSPLLRRSFSLRFASITKILSSKTEIVDENSEITILDLPDLALECILELLSPSELCNMAGVCCSLRDKSASDHLWEKHFKHKWGRILANSAYREWQCYISSKGIPKFLHSKRHKTIFQRFSGIFCNKLRRQEKECGFRTFPPLSSTMYSYLALETGKFWFPAQVFNREVQNGHVGFMLSCYDAKLSYNSTTDNFIARYPSHGRSIIEENIEWNRIRATMVDSPANDLHQSTCLDELKPGDHVEIQWRRNEEFPYGWWYGVVGHIQSCSAHQFNCQCHLNDTVILEFKQFSVDSRWRKTAIYRKNHRETGNDTDGFYGGIIKLSYEEDTEKWRQFWPKCTLA